MTVTITFKSAGIEFTLPPQYDSFAESLAKSFAPALKKDIDNFELFALFLEHCVNSGNTGLIQSVFNAFQKEFNLGAQSIYSIISSNGYDDENCRRILKAYFSAWPFVNFTFSKSALFSQSTPSMVAVFGGNPGSASYLSEARWMVDVYHPLIDNYFAEMSDFMREQCQDSRFIDAYPNGLDVQQWILNPESTPEDSYLLSSPVSIPLVGLVQLMQVMVSYKTLGMTPGDFISKFNAMTGHSQGLAAAAALSTVTDEDSFYNASKIALGLWIIIGSLPQISYPQSRIIKQGLNEHVFSTRGRKVYPMISVQGVTKKYLDSKIFEFNSQQSNVAHHMQLAVINTNNKFVVAGQIEPAAHFAQFLRSKSATINEDQSHIMVSQRKPVIQIDYLNITAPYHCDLLCHLIEKMVDIAYEKKWIINVEDMNIPVRACDGSGQDIRLNHNITKYLLKSMCVLPVDWPSAVKIMDIKHVVYFGSDGLSGFGKFTFKNIEGRGIPVICAGKLVNDAKIPYIGVCSDLHHVGLENVTTALDWLKEHGPKLVKTIYNGSLHIETAMHRVFGLPPLMVAGMTPTTVNEEFVAAISNVGYHVELAGGGIYSQDSLRKKVHELSKKIKPGSSITINCIYVNQKQWSFQYPGILQLRSEGYPIVGLCIGGGVPSTEKAVEIVETLKSAGFKHVSFKPSNVDYIMQIVEIAQKCDKFPIGLQWTGGRSGGHHSFEDFHEPILKTYAAIRECKNIVLIAGSGFGDADGSLPYLTGSWSLEYGCAPMPFDGILLGSRVMVAKEAATAKPVKELIVATPGLTNDEWKVQPTNTGGGVISIYSEYGERNHVLATRLAIFSNDLQESIFNKPRGERLTLLLERKDEIIAGLNANHTRPWFGRKPDGKVVDLEEMTYAEVISRLIELLFNKKKMCWDSDSYFKFVIDFITHAERRVVDINDSVSSSIVESLGYYSPSEYVKILEKTYPILALDYISSEDIKYFIAMCKQSGQKPVPFIPVLDEDLHMFILKGAYWVSESKDSIVKIDPERTLIQQGIVAASHSTKIDEPVTNILDGIYFEHVKKLLNNLYNGDVSNVPSIEYIGGNKCLKDITLLDNVAMHEDSNKLVFQLPQTLDKLPPFDLWLQALAGTKHCWLYAFLNSAVIVSNHKYMNNFMLKVMRPQVGQNVTKHLSYKGIPYCVEVTRNSKIELVIRYNDVKSIITLEIYQPTPLGVATLQLRFIYHPEQPLSPIHLDVEQYTRGVQKLYAETWFDNSDKPTQFSDIIYPNEIISTSGFVITKKQIDALNKNICSFSQKSLEFFPDKSNVVSANFALLATTSNVLRVTSSSLFGSGQLNIVQLYNYTTLADGFKKLKVGDHIQSYLTIDEIVNTAIGRQIKVTCCVYSLNNLVATVNCALVSRNNPVTPDLMFQKVKNRHFEITLESKADILLLESKDWFLYCKNNINLMPMSRLDFYLDSHYKFKTDTVYSSISTTGKVYLTKQIGKPIHIANIDFVWGESASDPVISYLSRHQMSSTTQLFDNGGYNITPQSGPDQMVTQVNLSNIDCARVSGDYNPIHTNPYLAAIAELPGTITHGVWTSAAIRDVVEGCTTDYQSEKIYAYQNNFVGMVLPGDKLLTNLQHVGMVKGRMLIKGQTINQNDEIVLECTAEVDQPLTAYVFTGQGSQEIGMGMDLYANSAGAKSVWDSANAYMLYRYGVSILDIVRNNPTELTVYFGGEAGKTILQTYLSLPSCDVINDNSQVVSLFTNLNSNSSSYTFRSATGLLNATQFTQVALVVNSMATIADMHSRGLIPSNAIFAGHSLGEYAALLALGNIFTLEDMIDIVFCRGVIMQSAVERDIKGNSEYGMIAVNTSHVGDWFKVTMLEIAVCAISENSGNELIQIVNFNVEDYQYVVAGTKRLLAVLQLVLDQLSAIPIDAMDSCNSFISTIVRDLLAKSVNSMLKRGKASTPLEGIDVPFHSNILKKGIISFRNILSQKVVTDGTVDYAHLCGHYIPNLTGIPFDISQDYFQLVYKLTGSSVIKDILNGWTKSKSNNDYLASVLLTELLAYQYASPVQWIKTQESMFDNIKVDRIVEIGTKPILGGMASQTMKRYTNIGTTVTVLHVENDKNKIYYLERSAPVVDADTITEQPVNYENQPTITDKPEIKVETLTDFSVENNALVAAVIPEVPLKTIHIIRSMVAHKTKQTMAKISTQNTIKSLVGGKSTLQNEIIGDLHKEFGSKVPEKIEEMTLQEAANKIGSSSDSNLGKHTQSQVSRLFSTKMPGGFTLTNVHELLANEYGLGPQRQNAVLLVALTMEPAERLANKQSAIAWIDSVAKVYAQMAEISYTRTSTSTSGKGKADAAISSAAMDLIQKRQTKHVLKQIEVLADYIGIDTRQDSQVAEQRQSEAANHQTKLDQIYTEFGSDLIDGSQPRFSREKIRKYDSSWNWSRQYAYEWIQDVLVNGKKRKVNDSRNIHYLRNCAHPELVQMLSGIIDILESSYNSDYKEALDLANNLHAACSNALDKPPVYVELSTPMGPQTDISSTGVVSYKEISRESMSNFTEFVDLMCQPNIFSAKPSEMQLPMLNIRIRSFDEITGNGVWIFSDDLTKHYHKSMKYASTTGLTFTGKTALVTGCGIGSIGVDIVRGLLIGGAQVVATYYSYNRATIQYFEEIYRKCGATGSKLVVVPFNQGSTSDVTELINYIYGDKQSFIKGLGWDLDFVFPFAAVTDVGSTATNLGSHSEFAQRVMLTNVLRLLGAIKTAKESRNYRSRPSVVILPLSPNHGNFGGEGLYGECKIGLETAFNRWESESWKGYLSVVGAVIGWTRGTGLMNANNLVAQHIEKHGAHTFSTCEMAFIILSLLYPHIYEFSHSNPIWVDLRGGVERLFNIGKLTWNARHNIEEKSKALQMISNEVAIESHEMYPHKSIFSVRPVSSHALANFKHYFPTPVSYDTVQKLPRLNGMVNLDKVVVITGYGEVGPYGNAETRWEMEAFGEFSMAGCIELAWIMGLIKHFNGTHPMTGQLHIGWVDAKTNEPVSDVHIKSKYEKYILEHTGIRLIEPELANGYDPTKKHILREIQIEHNMDPFETSAEVALSYKQSNGEKVYIWENSTGNGMWNVQFLKGAIIRVPAAAYADRLVAALLPTGWDVRNFGLPEDIAEQVDPITHFTLVATVEALVRSGITDPYELYKYMHISEVGNTTGSAVGGMKSIQQVLKDRFLDKSVANDKLQETFTPTTQAWVNMLLMSGSGPVKPIVGACATAAVSIEVAVESIQLGKAKFMLAGGVEDFSELSSTEFANMGASINTVEDIACGREPSEMSRPCTTTRKGFVESHGASIVTLMSATTALKMGAPIYGIVAMSSTATDKQGRSVPAPGKGMISSARSIGHGSKQLPKLSLEYRRRQLKSHLAAAEALMKENIASIINSDSHDAMKLRAEIEYDYDTHKRLLLDVWGNDFWKNNPQISPLRGSLAVWGLTADDIGLASFHGTSTVANDKNESDVLNTKLKHIGRTPGHVLPVVCQKWLTGHSKGSAAGHMLNGILQSMRTGLIPGNRNADNIDADFKEYDYLLYLSKSVQTPGIKAALLASFGFGQVGSELLIVHPNYLFAAVDKDVIDAYNIKLKERDVKAYRYWQDTLVGNHPFIQIKEQPPYTAEQEKQVLLNPVARAHYDAKTKQYRF